MNKRFANLFGLNEEESIALLNTPIEQLAEDDSRYVAASQLANYPSDRAIAALIAAVQNSDESLNNRITRRKAVESLGKLQASQALQTIRTCLGEEDCYLVENAVWAIGEIGTQDAELLEEVTQLLAKPGQLYRVIIQTLAKLKYQPAIDRIRAFIEAEDPSTAGAAMSAICQLTQDFALMERVVELLQHPKVFVRRLAIQDLIDARYDAAIPQIACCPVSLVFRLRGIRLLAEEDSVPTGKVPFDRIQPYLEQVLRDRPDTLELVHRYEGIPTLPDLVRELYETDFGRCYLATQTILEHYPQDAPAALLATYEAEAHNDYGAHYHVMKLMGWLKYAPAYDLLLEALHNTEPQFQKSRAAAALALAELGDARAIDPLKACLETKIWDLKYAALMALEQLGDPSGREIAASDRDWLVQAKAIV
jgi:bilin biosynthesis protein